jgi:hypothetical protein
MFVTYSTHLRDHEEAARRRALPKDQLTAAAARALAEGDPLGALSWVALRHDVPAP